MEARIAWGRSDQGPGTQLRSRPSGPTPQRMAAAIARGGRSARRQLDRVDRVEDQTHPPLDAFAASGAVAAGAEVHLRAPVLVVVHAVGAVLTVDPVGSVGVEHVRRVAVVPGIIGVDADGTVRAARHVTTARLVLLGVCHTGKAG